jgi:hypothetical protein
VLRHVDPVSDEMDEGLPTDFVLTKRKRLRFSKSLLLRMRGILDEARFHQRMIASASLMEALGEGDHGEEARVMGPDFQWRL